MRNNKKRILWDFLLYLSYLVLSCTNDVNGQKRPPNYSQEDMPTTSFSCREKIVGGYYADPETDCQMFHVCVRVPGVGIQDFRFLCPNDTLFDQEHQICDDWYNIDCELSSLYYSDNFDLYRIGVKNEIKNPKLTLPNKGTPIPLGPSSTVQPFINEKTKKPSYTSVNNGIGDEEDEYYKRSGNSIAGGDILRGSSSGNFFDSKNKGRDDLINNDYESPKVGFKRPEVQQNFSEKKPKTFVRKLASKRPVSQKNLQETSNQKINDQNSRTKSQNQYSSENNKVQTKSRGNVNFNNFNTNANTVTQQSTDFQKLPVTTIQSPTIYQKINNLSETYSDTETDRNYQERKRISTAKTDSNKNYENVYRSRQSDANNIKLQKQNTYKTSIKTSTSLPLQTNTFRLPSTEYLQTIANNYQQPALTINNQLQDSGANSQQSNFDQYQELPNSDYSKKLSSFSSYENDYQQYYNNYQPSVTSNYETTAKLSQLPFSGIPSQNFKNNLSASKSNHYETSPSSQLSTLNQKVGFHSSYTTPISYIQPNTTVFDYYKYYQTTTVSPTVNYQKTKNYFSTSDTHNNNLYQSSTGSPLKYNPYVTYQKANEKNDEEEFLKTAPSSNLKPSDLNTIYNQKKQSYINATLKATYNIEKSQKPSFSFYKPIVANTLKPTSFSPELTTLLSNTLSSSLKPALQAVNTPKSVSQNLIKPSVTPKSSHDYDYAYYDSNAGSSEYDQLDTVGEDFARINKNQKTT